jgi:hypothetical protein
MRKGGDSHVQITPLKGIKRMNLNVPIDLHRRFKMATASEDKDMTEVLLEFIQAYVEKHAPVPPSRKGGRQ